MPPTLTPAAQRLHDTLAGWSADLAEQRSRERAVTASLAAQLDADPRPSPTPTLTPAEFRERRRGKRLADLLERHRDALEPLLWRWLAPRIGELVGELHQRLAPTAAAPPPPPPIPPACPPAPPPDDGDPEADPPPWRSPLPEVYERGDAWEPPVAEGGAA